MENKIARESDSKDKLEPIKVKEEKNDLKTENLGVNVNIKSECEKCVETVTDNKVAVKTELHDLKVYDEISLSDGELSKEFESFSSLVSEGEIDDLDLSSLEDDDGCNCNNDNFNVVIQIENELAFKSARDGNGQTYRKNEKYISVRHSKTENCLGDYTNKRYNGCRDYKDHKSWHNNTESYKYSRRDKRSGEREVFSRKRSPSPRDYDRHRSNNNDRSKNGRRIDAKSRFRRSKSIERTSRYRSSRSLEKSFRSRSPNYKDRKIERKHFNNFDVKTRRQTDNGSSVRSRRKRSSFSNSPTSVWKRLDSRISPDRLSSYTKKSYNKPSRKKERTPFLVELERKLKEADILTYTKLDTTKAPMVKKDVTITQKDTETATVPEPLPAVNQNPNPPYHPTYVPFSQNVSNVVHPFQYLPMPTLSVDNLPLVPGPNGLPVHITITGEHILHDMDGKRIPVGPNGYYLPLDPTGRLYAHIVSPGNEAVPIHMTDDGVLRLPNLEPVPFGPGHKLPVNVDGNYILIGPDSKPLYPCLNLPREPPLQFLHLNAGMNYQNIVQQPVLPPAPPPPPPPPPPPMVSQPPQPENQQSAKTKSKWQPIAETFNGSDVFPPSKGNLPLNEVTDSKNVWQRSEDNNIMVSTKSQEIGNRCTSKFSPAAKDDASRSGSDMALDSCDSENSTSSIQIMMNPKKGSCEEIQLSSDDDEANCDKNSESSKARRKDAECDSKDAVAKKIHEAIKSLSESSYKPPAFGRFILSKITRKIEEKLPNESPLVRNRVKLPFLTPNAFCPANQPVTEDITFVFLSKKNPKNGENSLILGDKSREKSSKVTRISNSTTDFAVQCDFTSDEITKLKFQVAKLESEVIRLRELNMNFLNKFRNTQAEKT